MHPRYRSLRWLPARVARWLRRRGPRTAVVVDVRYVADLHGGQTRDPWNELWVTVDDRPAKSLGSRLVGRDVREGRHRVRVEGSLNNDSRRVLLRELSLNVQRGTVAYLAVQPPHGWLRPRTTKASWILAEINPNDLGKLSMLVPTRLRGAELLPN